MAKAVREAERYCLSFTAAGLKPELAAVIARIHAETGNWKKRVPWCWSAMHCKPAH